MPPSSHPTLVRRLSDRGMTREEFCKSRAQGDHRHFPPSTHLKHAAGLDGLTPRPHATDAELAGFVSPAAADEYCRNNFRRGANLKRCGARTRSNPFTPSLKRSCKPLIPTLPRPTGSIGNNKLPEPLKNYWNYENKADREAGKA